MTEFKKPNGVNYSSDGEISAIELSNLLCRTLSFIQEINPYIKLISKQELIEKYNNPSTRKKDKQKIKNELVKRGGVVFG